MATVTISSDFGAQEKRKEWERLEISSRKLEILRGDHLTYLLRNLYAGQEATVRTGQGTTDWFQRGNGVRQSCILSPAYLTSIQSTS